MGRELEGHQYDKLVILTPIVVAMGGREPSEKEKMEMEMKAEKAEAIKVACDIHPWMLSWAYVTEATHWAVTDANCNFSITGLPPGEYKVELWHESLGKGKETVEIPADGGATVEFKMGAKSGGGRRRR